MTVKLTVFGASGAIGGHVIHQALDAGHSVTAVVRNSAAFSLRHPALNVVTVPGLRDATSLEPALDGSDAAISGVGPRRRKDITVASSTARGMLSALEATGVRRFVAVSAAPLGPVPPGETWLFRHVLLPFISTLLREIYADLAVMEDDVRRSATEWTIVRPPRLTDGPLTGAYRRVIDGNVPRGRLISRADVAHAMLAALDDPACVKQAIGVAR